MMSVSSHEAKQRFGEILSTAAHTPVSIMRYDRRAAVIISAEAFDEYENLKKVERRRLASELLDRIAASEGREFDLLVRNLPAALGRRRR